MTRILRIPILGLLALGALFAPPAVAQCLLANPSFELTGSAGQVFGGWYQFGSVGSSTEAVHGARSARVSGPNTGTVGVSGYWQRLDTAPGQRWEATVHAWHTAVRPLAGGSRAILNIEWRNASEALISYESHVVADAGTPLDEVQDITVVSGPAPNGTASTRLLLAVVQEAADPQPDAYFDEATFYNLGPPTLDQLQWNDFPGGRTVQFSGRTWRVKGPGFYGPGPNLFCDGSNCVWVDAGDRLHLTVQNLGGGWYSSEVTLEEALGYGDYVFTTRGRLDTLHPNVVLGMFLWQYGPCYDPAFLWWNPYNEIDVEISRWGNPANDVAQFVAQPYDFPGNIRRFAMTFGVDEITSHAFRWLPDRVEYRSWRGGPDDEAPGTLVHAWTYTGPHIPRPEQPRVHINLWQFQSPPSSNQEVVFDSFTFVPEDPGTVDVPGDAAAPAAARRLAAPRPNPFTARTTLRFVQPAPGVMDLAVYDVRGRRVRTLVRGAVGAGVHDVAWDGRDDAGRAVAPGLYLARYRSGGVTESRRLLFLD